MVFKMTTMFFIKIQMQDESQASLHEFKVYSRFSQTLRIKARFHWQRIK